MLNNFSLLILTISFVISAQNPNGAVNRACGFPSPSSENDGFNDGTAPRLVDETSTHCNGSKPSSYSSFTFGFGAIPLTDSEQLRRLVVASAALEVA
ncbi:hypothetical protein V6N11_017823 [Hibiscus sabdariffa]|uniref:Uncharacterized protein n=1 Tax=Hibiscus sabdariffa TaxID=183260 RepID=A0ABR2T629_9ROSI